MFQTYAVEYSFTGQAQKFGTTVVVDLEAAKENGYEEMGDNRRDEIKKAIACRRFGAVTRKNEVELIEVARLGEPTQTP